MKTHVKYAYCALLITVSLPLCAETKTFIREYTYTAVDADTKITARAIALDQVKRIVLEEVGIYLQSEMKTTKEEKNGVYSELTKHQMQSVTAGITETKIVEERWDGKNYYIKASISVDPDEVTKHIARVVADQGKLKELEEVKRKADEAVAAIKQLRGEFDSAKSEKDKLIKQKEYFVASNILSATDWFQKGYNSYELKEYDNAFLYYQKAIELNPQYSDAYYNLGRAYHDKGSIDKAIQLYDKVIELSPKDYAAYSDLGGAYSDKGNLDRAIQLYEKAIDLNPKYSVAYYNLGFAYSEKGNLDRSIQFYEKAIEVNPQYSKAYNNLGLVYFDKGNPDKAIQLYEKAIELNPKDYAAYGNMGNAYSDKGNPDKASQLYKRAIELNPQFSNAYNNLGLVYANEGNLDKAIQLFEKAIEVNPEYSNAYFNLASAYEEKGDSEKAIGLLRKAAQLGNKDAQQWLKQNGYSW